MRKAALLALCLAFSPLSAFAAGPVVVELFTAQGCASCGEANAHFSTLAERPGVLALTFPVDYWDYLGWTDTFARPEFAERQKAYVAKLGLREPYTPQVIVEGSAQVAGLQSERLDRMIRDAARSRPSAPDMAFLGQGRVDVGSGKAPRGGAEVWLIRYDPRRQEVAVRRGENRGESIVHRNVVREIRRLGSWRGRPTAYRLPQPQEEGLASVVLVQASGGGRIVGVLRREPHREAP